MALSPPPEDPQALHGFPEPQPPIGPGRPPLFRIFLNRDPETGELRHPFWFGSATAIPGAAGGRYDMPPPDGACYLALSAIGAWLEVFRSALIVASEDVRRRRLFSTRPPRRIRTADLLSPKARAYGITGDVHTVDGLSSTRVWAQRLHEAGFRALLGKVRHDPALRERSLTLLDRAGGHEPFGWRWRRKIERLDDVDGLLSTASSYGFRVLEPPHDVVTDDTP